jgi:hypothetical protein
MIYNEFAKILVGHDQTGAIRQFDEDGDLTAGDKIKECFVISIARLLNKDEIKKGSFYMDIDVSSSLPTSGSCAVGGRDNPVQSEADFNLNTANLNTGATFTLTDTEGNTVVFEVDTGVITVDGSVNASGHVIVGTSGNATPSPTNDEEGVDIKAAVEAVTGFDQSTQAGVGGVPANQTNLTLKMTANADSGNVTFQQVTAGTAGDREDPEVGTTNTTSATLVAFSNGDNGTRAELKISDTNSQISVKSNSPVGEYGILKCDTYNVYPIKADCTDDPATCTITYSDDPAGNYDATLLAEVGTSGAKDLDRTAGLIFYQAGVVVLNPFIFERYLNTDEGGGYNADGTYDGRLPPSNYAGAGTNCQTARVAMSGTNALPIAIEDLLEDNTINTACTALRKRINKAAFNNTPELNSTIYFCRAGHNDFNYSSNPTYLKESKIRVKEQMLDAPVSYITTVGLYAADNELLAVAKLSEPLRKDPTNEMVLRVRLDY